MGTTVAMEVLLFSFFGEGGDGPSVFPSLSSVVWGEGERRLLFSSLWGFYVEMDLGRVYGDGFGEREREKMGWRALCGLKMGRKLSIPFNFSPKFSISLFFFFFFPPRQPARVRRTSHLSEYFQVEAVTDLFFLRYLSLRGNWNISSLPDSLEKLINLETLDIKGTRISELPLGIVKLKCLRHLLCDYVTRVPVGIGCLTTLEKLRVVIGYKGISKDLDMLTRLRSLEVWVLDGDEGSNVFATIEKMKFLHSLYLGLMDQASTILDVQRLTCPPPSLQRLRLAGSMDKSPMWILKLANLVKLHLADSKLKDFTSFFDGLQFQLPKLAVLKLDTAFVGMESLWFKKGGFPRLRHLGLEEHYDLKLIQIEEGAMPVIQQIALADSPLLEVPMGIEHLTNLKAISVFGVPTQLSDAMRNHRKNTPTSPFIFTDDRSASSEMWYD